MIKLIERSLVILCLSSCATSVPKWDGMLWLGENATSSITRVDSLGLRKHLLCSEPQFKDMVCMSMEDYKSFVKTYVYSCSEWDISTVFAPKGTDPTKPQKP